MASIIGCAESILASCNPKQLSVHEIWDSMVKEHTYITNCHHSTLAAALFHELQKPNSRFERNGNKFTLRNQSDSLVSKPNADSALSPRRSRRKSSLASESNDRTLTMVKLSTTTNPQRSRNFANIDFEETRTPASKTYKLINVSNPDNSEMKPLKPRVRFALERNEVFVLPVIELDTEKFPSLTL